MILTLIDHSLHEDGSSTLGCKEILTEIRSVQREIKEVQIELNADQLLG